MMLKMNGILEGSEKLVVLLREVLFLRRLL